MWCCVCAVLERTISGGSYGEEKERGDTRSRGGVEHPRFGLFRVAHIFKVRQDA